MTVSTTKSTELFTGNGATTVFPFAFPVLAKADLSVLVADASGAERRLTLEVDYSVELIGKIGGKVTLPAPLQVGQGFAITRVMQAVQETDLRNQGAFFAETHEDVFDRLTMLIQQTSESADRSLKVPVSDGPVNPTLPSRDNRKGRVLAFHETTGDPAAGPSIAAVNSVAGAVAAIQAVSENLEAVNTTADHIGNVDTVAGHIDHVDTVAEHIANIDAVVTYVPNIDVVARSIDAVNAAAANMGAILAAPTHAQTAVDRAQAADLSAMAAAASASAAGSSQLAAAESAGTASEKEAKATASASSAAGSASTAFAKAAEASSAASAAKGSAATAASDAAKAKTEADRATVITGFGDIEDVIGPVLNYPSVRPSLNLDLINRNRLPPWVQFIRPSKATRTNERGRIEVVAENQPRFDFDPVTIEKEGLHIEEQRTNLFSGKWGASRTTLTPMAAASPCGAMDAMRLAETEVSGQTQGVRATVALTGVGSYVASMFVKAETISLCALSLHSAAGGERGAEYDLSTKSVKRLYSGAVDAGVVDAENGWLRLWVKVEQTIAESGTLIFYLEGYTSQVTGLPTKTLLIWGTQVESGSFLTSYIQPATTFTSRASTATYIGSDGQLKAAAANEPRWEYNPDDFSVAPILLLEEQRTNLVAWSETTVEKLGLVSSARGVTSFNPDGSITFTANDVASGQPWVQVQAQGLSTLPNEPYCGSTWLRAGGNFSRLDVYVVAKAPSATDYYAGSIVIKNPGGGRVFVVGNPRGGDIQVSLRVSFVGAEIGASVTLHRTQIEKGAYPTSYIPTNGVAATRAADVYTSAAATRAADDCVVQLIRSGPATLLADVIKGAGPLSYAVIASSKNSTGWADRLQMVAASTDRGTSGAAKVIGQIVTQAGTNNPTIESGIERAIAAAFSESSVAMAANGELAVMATGNGLPSISRLVIGASPAKSSYANGHIRRIAYWPIAMNESQLKALTQ